MADMHEIRAGMQVLGSDGGMVGEVSGLHGDHIHIRPTPPAGSGADYSVPRRWVARVDEHVHLDRDAALVRQTWTAGEPGGAAGTGGEARLPDDYHGVGKSWIVWLIGALMLGLVLILGIRGCSYAADDPAYEDNARGEIGDADRAASGAANAQ